MSFPGRAVQRTWHLVDAASQTVGRLATTIAPLLKGKHKPTYRPDGDCGDFVVVVKKAILGMLHRNNLRGSYLEPRLRIYAGSDHPHTAQLPPGVVPLPAHPRKRRGNFHFGLGETYSATPFVEGR